MKRSLLIGALAALAIFAAGAAAGRILYRVYPVQMSLFAALTRNYVRSWGAPPGATTTELNPAYKSAAAPRACAFHCADGRRRRRRLAELQQDAHFGALFAARRDQRQDRRQAQDPVHVRHQTIHELRARPDHGQRGSDRHDADRHFLDQPGHLRRELAHARGRFRPRSSRAMRGAAYLDGMLFRGSQDGRVLAYDFKTGKRIWQTTIADREQGRVRRRRSDRLERTGFHRQRGRRRQGRQGAHVCARRQNRQNRVGVLSCSQDRGRSAPRSARRLAARCVDLGQRGLDSRSAAARPGPRTRSIP